MRSSKCRARVGVASVVLIGVALIVGVVCVRGSQQPSGDQDATVAAEGTLRPSSVTSAPSQETTTSIVKPLTVANTMYCFAVMLPFGGEVDLMQLQYEKSLGLFKCDAHAVFSNVSFALSANSANSEHTVAFGGDMVVDFNTWTWAKFNTKLALNTAVFITAWKKVFDMGIWKEHDWTLKVDPDTVFFVGRMRYLLDDRPLLPDVEASFDSQCGMCKSDNQTGEEAACESHVHYLQSKGLTCAEALHGVSRPAPLDCGCYCPSGVCKKPKSVYLRNCAVNQYEPDDAYPAHAMHGPLEVLSRTAMEDFQNGIDHCAMVLNSSFTQWGEDWFLEHCLLILKVNPLDSFSSLKDGDCATRVWPCDMPHAAFQPFKDTSGFLKCTENAIANGTWPPTDPQYAEHKFYDKTLDMWVTEDSA